MTQSAARKQINRRFGAGPHWSVADPLDQFLGLARQSSRYTEEAISSALRTICFPKLFRQ